MNKIDPMQLWLHFWKRPAMYVGQPSVGRIGAFWWGFQLGRDQEDASAKIFRDFEHYVEKRMRTRFDETGMPGRLSKKFGDGDEAERKKVEFLSRLANTYGFRRFGSKAYVSRNSIFTAPAASP